jgi:hypothetical protein
MRWIFVYATLLGSVSTALAQDKFPNGPMGTRPAPATKGPSAAADSTLPSTARFDDAQVVSTRFDDAQVVLKMVDRHWQVWSGKVKVKDFDLHEREANEAIRLIHDMHLSQYSTIPGATPPFEFWLADDAAPKTGLGTKNLIMVNQRNLKAENVTGAWIIHDDRQMLYNFGPRQEAALAALGVLKKFGFNQLGAIGAPTPVMTYLLVDPLAQANGPPGHLELKDIAFKLSQQGLLLPNLGYVGSRVRIEPRRLEALRFQGDWMVVQGKDVVVRFGPNATDARDAMRLLLETHVNEMCLIGKNNFPIFLNNGKAPREAGLGFNSIRLQPSELKLKVLDGVDSKGRRRDVVYLAQGEQILFELGDDHADGELVLKVLKHFGFDQLSPVGTPAQGGMRFLSRSK